MKEAKVEEVDQQEEVSGENWGVGVLKFEALSQNDTVSNYTSSP